MEIDDRGLEELLEESKDIHSDAMRVTRSGLADLVEAGKDGRAAGELNEEEGRAFAHSRDSMRKGLIGVGATAGIAGAVLALGAAAADGASSSDIQILQTAQSIENLAIATYTLALKLSFIGGASANKVVKTFVTQTKAQHMDHDSAFGSALHDLGGKMQNAPDPVLLQVVNKAKSGLTSPAAVVALALELEDGAAQTYVANTSALSNINARRIMASVMGVEAQHAAVLRAVQALLHANDSRLIALPPTPLTALPAAAGSVGFPNAYYPTINARPKTEGALSK